MKIPLLAFIFQGLPEQIGVVTLAFIINKLELKWKRVCLYGFALAFTAFVLRSLPISFGVHTVVLIGFLFWILYYREKININNAIITSILCFLALVIIEMFSVTIIIKAFAIDLIMLEENVIIRTLVTLPQVFIIYLIAFIIKAYRK